MTGSLILNVFLILRKSRNDRKEHIQEEEKALFSTSPVDEPTEPYRNEESCDDKVNVNTAGVEELLTLNGIGEDLANKILQDRGENGLFKDIHDLTRVTGLGEKKLEMFSENITC